MVTGAQDSVGLDTGTNYLVSNGQDTVYRANQVYVGTADTTTGAAYFTPETNHGTAFVTINGGAGQFDLGQNSNVTDSATVGSAISVQGGSFIAGGIRSAVTFSNADGTGTISGGNGDTISATGNLTVFAGQDQSISVTGALGFLRETGKTTIDGGNNSTIFGSNGLAATANMTGYTIITGNQPGSEGNQTYNASASSGNLEFRSGLRTSQFIGGSGNAHLVFGTAIAGASTGDSNSTVTGGAGANSYGVLAGHNGGPAC